MERWLTVNDVLGNYAKKAIEKNPGWFTPHQIKVLHKLIDCRTAELGCQGFHCEDCGEDAFRYASCNDRHCPTCGANKREDWRERMLEMQLPVQSLHLVFTLPHEFNPLVLRNQAVMLGLFFIAIRKTLTRVLRKDFGCQPGFVNALHTWGQRVNPLTYCHVLVFAGGPSLDGTRWVDIPTDVDHPICPLRLAKYFRKTFLRGVRRAFDQGKLTMPDAMRHVTDPDALERWLTPVLAKNWKVHSQKPPAHCKDARNAIKYLSHYISGTAISNYRILHDDGEYVTIRVKSYRRKCHVTMRIKGKNVKRFAFHILPLRFKRVRYGGFLGARFREENLRHCRRLLGVAEEEELQESVDEGASEPSEISEDRREDADAERYPFRCPRCGHAQMRSCRRHDGLGTRVLLAARQAFWARVYTVASTIENLQFVYPHDLPIPET